MAWPIGHWTKLVCGGGGGGWDIFFFFWACVLQTPRSAPSKSPSKTCICVRICYTSPVGLWEPTTTGHPVDGQNFAPPKKP